MCLISSQQIIMPTAVAISAHRRYIAGHNECHLPIAMHRFYSDIHRKEIDLKVAKGKKLIVDTIASKKQKMQQHKAILVQELRDKKTKVKEKVKAMEEIVERENILTIPNLLCVGRGILAPYVGYVIVQGDYQLAIGLLVVAGITDLVIVIPSPADTYKLHLKSISISTVGRFHCTQLDIASKQIGIIFGSNG